MTTPDNPPPVFNPNVPQIKDTIAKSQIDFLDNFSTLYDAFSVNHVALDAASDAGNHTVIQLLEQPTNSQFQTGTTQISVYAKDVVGQTDQMFLRYGGNQPEFQYTNYQIYPLALGNGLTPFFVVLPGGIIVYFGIMAFQGLPTLGGPFRKLVLTPAIAKNIISANFCNLGTIPGVGMSYSPIQPNNNGIYDYVQVRLTLGGSQPNPNLFYYIVVANT
jgi:hypothetical protein